MTLAHFNEFQKSINDEGMQILDAQYHASCFGSWHIAVNTQPRRRIVWEGKESTWLIQQETSKLFAAMPEWEDLSATNGVEQLPISSVIEFLRNGKKS